MDMQFRKSPLGRVAEVVPGFAFKSEWWRDSGIPVIRIKNILDDCTIDTNDVAHIEEAQLTPKMRKFFVEDGDILVAMTGATAGKTARFSRLTPMLLNQRVAKIVGRDIDPDFLWAVLGQRDYQQRLFHLADGAAQPNMSGSQIEALEIPFPSPALQQEIGRISRSYDDLIEVNTRRIAILEEMARRLFDEWFVAIAVEPLPDGWHKVCLGDLVKEIRDAVLPSGVSPDTPYVGLEHMPRRSLTPVEFGRADQVASMKHRFQAGDILFGKIRPYFHKVIIAPFNGVASSDAIIMRPVDDEARPVAACLASSDAFVAHAVQTSNGTKMPRANWSVLRNYAVTCSAGTTQRFAATVAPMQKLCEKLTTANTCLRTARDLLLPKLISGEIDLEGAERGMENAAEREAAE